jgi:hypothetical protein
MVCIYLFMTMTWRLIQISVTRPNFGTFHAFSFVKTTSMVWVPLQRGAPPIPNTTLVET